MAESARGRGGDTRGAGQGAPPLLAGRYELRARIGQGAMGSVFRAFGRELEREVAVESIRAHLTDDPGLVERFLREGRAFASVRHPGIIALHDLLRTAVGNLYLVLDLVDGEGADALIRAGSLPWGRCAEIGAEACDALEAAHAAGIVHRDIKPANVLLERDGRVRVADLGVALLSRAGAHVLSPLPDPGDAQPDPPLDAGAGRHDARRRPTDARAVAGGGVGDLGSADPRPGRVAPPPPAAPSAARRPPSGAAATLVENGASGDDLRLRLDEPDPELRELPGEAATGSWEPTVADAVALDDGVLEGWSVGVETAPASPSPTTTPASSRTPSASTRPERRSRST